MKINYLPEVEILDFEKSIGFELECNERPAGMCHPRFYVHFPKGESMEGGCLVGRSGNGNTIDEALKDLCKEISNRKLAFGAYSCERKEITCPKLVHTKLLNK